MPKSKPPRKKKGKPPAARVPIGFGKPSEWKAFLEANPLRIKATENVYGTCKKVFLRTVVSKKSADRLGFYLGRICVDEFSEILLMSGNGHGVGALKILRGMYERAVTAAYLLKHPEQADQFTEYHKIHKYKAYKHAKVLDALGPSYSPDDVKTIEDEYEAAKPMFLDVDCKVCKTTRVRSSWTKLDTASMAKKIGNGFEELYLDAFYMPTLQVHTTLASILTRLGLTSEGKMTFNPGEQRAEARHAFIMAHNLILRVLMSQNEHFALGLESSIQTNLEDFQNAYGPGRKTKD